MKYPIIFIFLFCSCVGYGQRLDTITFSMPVYADTLYKKPVLGLKKTKTSKVYYGLAGIRKSEPIDTQKLYFHKFIFFTEQMNKTVGKKSARFEDSCEKYYKLLYKK